MRVKMSCPVCHRAPLDHVVFRMREVERDLLREAVRRFGMRHGLCANAPELPEQFRRHRCGSCGLELLFGSKCPFHPSSERVRWTPELSAAYGEAVEALAKGERLAVPVGAPGDVLVLARRLRDKWGGGAA